MHPERWKTVEQIFHAALERAPEQRADFLNSACLGDPELRNEVESLLEETSKTGSFDPPLIRGQTVLNFTQSKSLTGRDLNHYRIGPLVGQGGMAEVYRARDTRLNRDVAIKVLHREYLFDRERLERFHREAQLLAAVNHPNIASVYGFEEANGISGLVLELVEGETLSERIVRQPAALPVGAVLDIALQITAALDEAHSKGIIHRDLKPSNIKITPSGMVKVLDFGIAKLLQSSPLPAGRPITISRQNVVLGTVAYMSPEQARGWTIDTRTDIWAFGCVLYEILAGTPAFQGETPTDIVVKIATEDPDWSRLSSVPEAASLNLQKISRKCLQKVPASRYQSVRELAVDLDNIRQQLTTSHHRTVSVEPHETEFPLPGKLAGPLFMLTQFGYLALYFAAMNYIDSIGAILSSDFLVPGQTGVVATIILAVCGVAVRIYLISAVGWRHPAAGDKFHKLFPVSLILDGFWAASPLLLWRHIGYGIAFTCVALMAYVPFAQRTMMRAIYPDTPIRGISRFFEPE